MVRAWLAAATMACGLLGATGAGADVRTLDFTVDSSNFTVIEMPPVFTEISGILDFPAVTLSPGDEVFLNLAFTVDYPCYRCGIGGEPLVIVTPIAQFVFIKTFVFGSGSEAFVVSNYENNGIDPATLPNYTLADLPFSISSVPEPTSWAIMLSGLLCLGGALRRYGVPSSDTPADCPNC